VSAEVWRGFVIPVRSPPRRLEVPRKDTSASLAALQGAVGGRIEALPFPVFDNVTAYVHDEGKFECVDPEGRVEVNLLATAIMRPVLWEGDFIAGPLVVIGFDWRSGNHRDLPPDIEQMLAALCKLLTPTESEG
jgi:hypothetical protein